MLIYLHNIIELDSSEENQKIYIYFKLKDDMLAEHAMDLMIEKNEKYIKSKESDKAIEYYKKIKSKSKEEVLELINNENN